VNRDRSRFFDRSCAPGTRIRLHHPLISTRLQIAATGAMHSRGWPRNLSRRGSDKNHRTPSPARGHRRGCVRILALCMRRNSAAGRWLCLVRKHPVRTAAGSFGRLVATEQVGVVFVYLDELSGFSTPKGVKAVIASSPGPRTVRRPSSGSISARAEDIAETHPPPPYRATISKSLVRVAN
jgi:hypothetical protein